MGDSSDKIAGIKGLGPKTLYKRFPELLKENLSLDDILDISEEKLEDHVIYARVLHEAEELEKNSNQILEYTKEKKNKDEAFKIIIVEALWKIIFSDGTSDMYESNLMRRLTGLLYLDNKIVGDIKNRIKNSPLKSKRSAEINEK